MLNHDKLKQRRAGNRMGNGWKPKDGESNVRILPPRSRYIDNWEEMGDVSIPYKIHFFKIEGKPTEVSRCLAELGQKCPACETWRAYRKSTDAGMQEMAKSIGPADQYLFNILDINDLGKGIQYWAANYTCWDKIIEIVANPAWGNPIDPSNGVNFQVTLTPGNRSKTGFNSYSVMPEPSRTTVMEILEGLPDWQATLDALEEQITAAKTAEEIIALLDEIGFPAPGASRRGAAPAAASASPAAVGAKPVAVGAAKPAAVGAKPVAVRPAPVPVPVEQEGDDDSTAEGEDDEAPRPPAAVARTQKAGVAAAAPTVHYDPGPQYANPTLDAHEIPAGAPRCYADYDEKKHRCKPCPVMSDCQLKMLGIN